MSFYPPASPCRAFQAALAPFLTDDGLPFASVLTAAQIEQACHDEGVHFGDSSRSIYNPAVTTWAFLSQVIGTDKSCRAAALRVLNLSVEQQRGRCSTDTGLYCRARGKPPASLWRRLTYETADQLERAIPAHWLWKGRHVHIADGTTMTLPDTEANQAAYPQPPGQKPGLGFPMIRMVVLLSLATAAVSGMAFGRYEGKGTGEPALLRQLLHRLAAGSVLLADCCYCSYFMVALLVARGVDVVVRQHQNRDTDFRRGERLGVDDHLVVWTRPECPDWMDQETYQRMPETLTVREVRKQVDTPGSRVDELVVVTTLVDPLVYSRDEVLDLFHDRWHVELDLRSIKVTLDLERLRCKTPAMVEKELWATLLGYTLVRKVSSQAALLAGKHPRQISFKASLQTVRESWGSMTYGREACRRLLGESLLGTLGQEQVGDRPDRCEPRAVKRRPKKQKLLTVPRQEARARLLRGGGR
jgi:putative transposase